MSKNDRRIQSPIMGDGFGGVDVHNALDDARNRVDWLRAHEAEVVSASGQDAFDRSLAAAEAELRELEENQ